jgi:peptide deformylase
VPQAPKLPPIVQTGALVLRTPAREVPPEAFGSKDLRDLVATMIAVMRAAPGVGLAAPQIGRDLRVIVLEDRKELIASLLPHEREERLREPFATRVLVNPKLTPIGDEKATFFEGCLSVHGYVGLVTRSLEGGGLGLRRARRARDVPREGVARAHPAARGRSPGRHALRRSHAHPELLDPSAREGALRGQAHRRGAPARPVTKANLGSPRASRRGIVVCP